MITGQQKVKYDDKLHNGVYNRRGRCYTLDISKSRLDLRRSSVMGVVNHRNELPEGVVDTFKNRLDKNVALAP